MRDSILNALFEKEELAQRWEKAGLEMSSSRKGEVALLATLNHTLR